MARPVKPRVLVRISPAVVRAVLLDAEATTGKEAAARAGVSEDTVSRWRGLARDLPDWPNDQDVTEWRIYTEAVAKAREADQRYSKRRYFAKGLLTVDPIGTRRRVQALYSLGWTWDALAAEMGVRKGSMWRLAHGSHCSDRGVYRETAIAVAGLYERLCMKRPTGWVADRARTVARRNGWVPPLAWLDIDDPDETPVGRSKNPGGGLPWRELLAEWDQLTEDYGFTKSEALKILGVTDDAIRNALKKKAAAEESVRTQFASSAADGSLEPTTEVA